MLANRELGPLAVLSTSRRKRRELPLLYREKGEKCSGKEEKKTPIILKSLKEGFRTEGTGKAFFLNCPPQKGRKALNEPEPTKKGGKGGFNGGKEPLWPAVEKEKALAREREDRAHHGKKRKKNTPKSAAPEKKEER